ncbi:MAG: hypothetical protein IPK76_10365 [Lewinellaceae bacterium]|jgi:hypothetical protein|nr:hypothetical protein [Lewinellaceae bacterium]
MAQIGWVFLDDRGGRHRVGLYHGDQSGHLMIHCNLRVVQIDFSVKDTKKYSFFIEDEFCEISVVKEKNGRFGYAFEVNKTVDTPRNRIRRVDERRIRWQMALFIAGFLVVLTAGFLGFRHFSNRQELNQLSRSTLFSKMSMENARRLAYEGKADTAQLFIVKEALRRKVYYGFTTADSSRISGSLDVPDIGPIQLPNGFPLTDRDAFLVTYLPSDPQVHRVDFYQPTRSTIEQYVRLAGEAEHLAHPDISQNRSWCMVLSAAELRGWQSLADFIYQAKTVEENERHNRDSYQRLVRDVDYSRLVREACWDQ